MISSSDFYTFESSSVSSLDTYGCLYSGSFNPSYPSRNQLICNDDGGAGLQFKFIQYLSSYETYILIVTTSSTYQTGSYSVSTTGPAYASMLSITPSQLQSKYYFKSNMNLSV